LTQLPHPSASRTQTTRTISAIARQRQQQLIRRLHQDRRQVCHRQLTDVTIEILNLSRGAPGQEGTTCADPTPDASSSSSACATTAAPAPDGANVAGNGSLDSRNYWPNALYDARRGAARIGGDGTDEHGRRHELSR
jgi:hypothetical protein